MTSLEDASGDPGNPAGCTGSLSGHGKSPTARETGGKLIEGSRHALAVWYATEPPPDRKSLPKGVGIALA